MPITSALLAAAREPERLPYNRRHPPARFQWDIKRFSSLSRSSINYSSVFEASGHKCNLILHPKGHRESNGKEHISFYLSIEQTYESPSDWKVEVYYRLFLYNWREDTYFTAEDKEPKRLHALTTQFGFERFISLEAFRTSGFLTGDSCRFGAEVWVTRSTRETESLTISPRIVCGGSSPNYTDKWTIENLCTLDHNYRCFGTFTFGDIAWWLWVAIADVEESMSIWLDARQLPPNVWVYVDFTLRVVNRIENNHKETRANGWVNVSNSLCIPALIALTDPWTRMMYIDQDALKVEVQNLTIPTVHVIGA